MLFDGASAATFRRMRWIVVAAAVAAVLAIGHWRSRPRQWTSKDLVLLLVGVLTSTIFVFLAEHLARRQADLTAALANAALEERVASLRVQSLRTLTTSNDLSLHVARAALSAWHLFPLADAARQEEFLATLRSAYSALTFNVFPHTNSLPFAQCRLLRDDGAELVRQLRARADERPFDPVSRSVRQTGTHIRTCLDIEEWLHGEGAPPSPDLFFLRELYRRELTVYAAWDDAVMRTATCRLELVTHLPDLGRYYSPWYVVSAGRRYVEVDYEGCRRNDVELERATGWPVYDAPLRHDDIVGSPLRHESISRMVTALGQRADADAIAILAVQLPDGRRIILDGNHRAAAALRMHGDARIRRCLVFTIDGMAHAAGGDEHTRKRADGTEARPWRGCNPDVEHLSKQPVRAGDLPGARTGPPHTRRSGRRRARARIARGDS